MLWKFKDCAKCRGALVLDGDEWRCWQCGTYYYPHKPIMDLPPESEIAILTVQATDSEVRARRARTRKLTTSNVSARIVSKECSDQRWRKNNWTVISLLKEGHTVRDISESIGKGVRQIRSIQERLKDMAPAMA